MTPQEKAVIQAAIEDLRGLGGMLDKSPLAEATRQLIYSCNECNTDRHQCYGCGEPIGHGDTDCGKDCTGSGTLTAEQLGTGEPNEKGDRSHLWGDDDSESLWVERTWVDVRAGDTVRMPGMPETEALITGRLYHPSEDPRGEHWHVVHDGTTGKWAHTNDVVVQPGECVIVSAGIQGAERGRWMNPAAPVEIQVPGPDPHATIEAIELAGGWSNRMGFMTSAPNPPAVDS